MFSARPLSRYAVRVLLAATRNRRWSHAQDWWPGLRIERMADGSGSIYFRGEHVAQVQSWDKLAGNRKEIVIVGSGPSIRSQHLELLEPDCTLLLNGSINLIGAQIEAPLAVVIEDERFVWRHFDDIKRLIPPTLPCFFSTSALRAICESDPSWLHDRLLFHLDFVERPYGRKRPSRSDLQQLDYLLWSESEETAISLAPDIGLVSGGSVAVSALQIALHLNPPRLGMAGIDLSNATQPRFYESGQSMARSRINHAKDRILEAFELGRIEGQRRAICLVNYSPVSALATIGIEYDNRLGA